MVSGKGRNLENALAEDLVLVISTTSTAGSESGSMRGEAGEKDKLSYKWPEGSNASSTITVRNPSSAGFLTNGDFETFTVADLPIPGPSTLARPGRPSRRTWTSTAARSASSTTATAPS